MTLNKALVLQATKRWEFTMMKGDLYIQRVKGGRKHGAFKITSAHPGMDMRELVNKAVEKAKSIDIINLGKEDLSAP